MSMPLRPGDRTSLGRYELVGRLGEGGMGTVFLGREPNGRPVAIKVVRPEFAHEPEFRGRFRSEVNRAQQVPPFSTAEVLDADPDHDPPYLVVEYVDGPSLAAEVREKGPLSGAALHGVAVGIATALTAIHGAGVIHRDLKPGNVLFARGGIKVIDFGIARAFEATSMHTRTDQMVGTVAYMAPERFDPADGRPVTAAADIFAWGAVVAYAATGRTPFAADSAAATAMRILTQPPNLAGLPATLAGPVERALAKDPAERPTARELLDMLLAGGSNHPAAPARLAPVAPGAGAPVTTAAPGASAPVMPAAAAAVTPTPPGAPAPARRRRRTALIVATVAAVLVAGGLGAAVRYFPDRSTAAGGPSPAPSSVVTTAAPSAAPAPQTQEERLQAIRAGKHRTLIHISEIDRDLALDSHFSQVEAGDGTGVKSEFALVPVGVDFLIRSLHDPAGSRESCLGVRVVPDEGAILVAAECDATPATVFSLTRTGGQDDQGRPTFTIDNDKHGFVQWSTDDKELFVEHLGDAPPLSTFSFVDRGPLPSPSPSR
ncbi:serine/threonine protein kinase [Actinoplanes sp. NBC_00393]|uniref:serine/threonine protein kinase n=1 Tax=Actinoplanes sp. NBC_00393 TaxID=2975953 RepID=UPI002E23DDFA